MKKPRQKQMGPQAVNMDESFKIFHYLDGSDYRTTLHHHDFYELYFLITGNLSYQIGNTIFALKRGDVLLFNIGQVHRPLFGSLTTPYERMVLRATHQLLGQLSSGESDLSMCFKQSYPLYRLSPEMQNSIRLLLSKLLTVQGQKGFGSELLYKAYLTEILVLLGRCSHEHTLTLNNSAKKSQIVEMVNHYIGDNLDKPITVDELAAHVYLSKFYFMRFFKAMTGTTAHSYILQKRLVHASNLMLEGETAGAAATQSGFGDYSCFFRAFKKQFACSPASYVEKHFAQP